MLRDQPRLVLILLLVLGLTSCSSNSPATSPTAAVAIALTPATSSLQTGQTTQFSAQIKNASVTTATWEVNSVVGGNSTVGTISSSGLYTAPSAVPTPATVTITAAATADSSASATATVTITGPAVSVSVTPATVSLQEGATQQFSATVANSSNNSVTWQVNGVSGGNATVGTVSSSGLYTAPGMVPSPATVSVTAVSVADTSATASAAVTITAPPPPVSVVVSPGSANVQVAGTQQFTATVNNATDMTVTWEVNTIAGGNSTVGSISDAGLYTAPTAVPSPATVTITAVSVSTPSASGTSAVTITAAPVTETVVVSPASKSVQVGTMQQFTAVASTPSDTSFTWSVNNVAGGNATLGAISASGLYTAPTTVPAPPSVTVMAAVTANPVVFGTAAVTITAAPPPITVAVSPTTASVQVNQTRLFTATVDNTSNTAVLWEVNQIQQGNSTVGTISSTGAYTAPAAVPSPMTVSVTAVSVADATKSATATVTVTPAPLPVTVTVTPATVSVIVAQSQQFTANVSNTSNTAVTWQVNQINGGNTTVGSISNTGLYTAPNAIPNPATVTISAVSQADTSKSGTAMATIQPLPQLGISISPNPSPNQIVHINNMLTFTATLTNDPGNSIVNWQLGCITADDSDNDECGDDDMDGGPEPEDGPGQIEAPGGTNSSSVANSLSVIYTAPGVVYSPAVPPPPDNPIPCPTGVAFSSAYVPLTATATAGAQTASQTICVEIVDP